MSKLRDPTQDLKLVQSARVGAPEAIDGLLERLRCVPAILAATNSRRGGPLTRDELEDLTQDVLQILWKRLDSYRGDSALESWVFPFCLLEMNNFVRRRNKYRRLQTGTVVLGTSVEPAVFEDPAASDHEALYAALKQLPSTDSSIIRLRDFDEIAFEEIGQRFDMPTNSVKTRYYRSLLRLRHLLRRDYAEEGS